MMNTTIRGGLSFRKSTYSGDNGGCIAAAGCDDQRFVLDTKDPKGPILSFSAKDWESFVKGLK